MNPIYTPFTEYLISLFFAPFFAFFMSGAPTHIPSPPPPTSGPQVHHVSPDSYALKGDSFSAMYSHGGGCSAHTYTIDYHIAPDGNAVLRMEHGFDEPDYCEAMLFGEAKLTLPAEVMSAPHIMLDDPAQGLITLR